MIITISTSGGWCEFDTESTGTTVAEYQDGQNIGGKYSFIVDLCGDHKGPPIRVIVHNPRMDLDEDDCYVAEFDKITYEDGKGIDDIVDNTYHDAIYAEVKNVMTGN